MKRNPHPPFYVIVALLLLSVPGAAAREKTRVTKEGRWLASALLEHYGASAASSKLYVGSEACMACHKSYAGWRTSMHATGLKTAKTDAYSMKTRNGIIVDYDNNRVDDFKQGLDFNTISSAFDRYKPFAPVLKYDSAKGYTIRIGNVEYPVVLTHGGSGLYKQRFLVKIPVSDRTSGLSAGTYYSPIQYNEATRQYVVYEPSYWYNADNTPKINGPLTSAQAAAGKSFDKECAGCHTTAIAVGKDSRGEYVSVAPQVVYARPDDPHLFELGDPANATGVNLGYNVGCERCHGPGSQHIINYALAPEKYIINPAKLTPKQANQICGSCHSRGKSVPNAVYDYPFKETTGQGYAEHLGEDLYAYFTDRDGRWPDKSESKQHHQQFQDFMRSSKWEFQFHKVTCYECHDVHKDNLHHLRAVMEVEGADGAKLSIPAKVEDNSMCLACHAGFGSFQELRREDIVDVKQNRGLIAGVVSKHTHHNYEPEGSVGLSRCTECHMAKYAITAVAYDIASHTFKATAPEQTLATQSAGGMPSSCAVRCHRPLAPLFGLPQDSSLTRWNESSDVALAQWLMKYYGPDGTWWKTKK